MMTAPLVYSLAAAAEQLSVSQRVLERLIADGKVESFKIGRRRVVAHEALEDYVAEARRSA